LKFYIDEDISYKIAEILRENNIDAVSAHEVGRGGTGITDEDQLAYAATGGRCLVTYNGRHYITLTNKFFEKEWNHAGIIIIPSSIPSDNFRMISRALIEYAKQHQGDMAPYSCDFLKAEIKEAEKLGNSIT
jgi:hypothetical protein